MSYCRFSSNNFKCDVYIYDDVQGGVVVHVARRRHVGTTPIPELPPVGDPTFMVAMAAQELWLNNSDLVDINLPHAGSTFHFHQPLDAIKKLTELKELGYMIPDYALGELIEEVGPADPTDSEVKRIIDKARKAMTA